MSRGGRVARGSWSSRALRLRAEEGVLAGHSFRNTKVWEGVEASRMIGRISRTVLAIFKRPRQGLDDGVAAEKLWCE